MTNNKTYALLSVSDKTGIVDFAKQLIEAGIAILATGGTATLLKENNITLTDVSDHTQFPEIMNGRVKTLHPKIHGGILARRGIDDDTLKEHQISYIDIVAVNLYPFEETIAKPDCRFADAIEKIDIGGPTLLRAAAKNCDYVTVAVDPDDYPSIIEALKKPGTHQAKMRRELAAKVFAHTAYYDSIIASYFSEQIEDNNELLAEKFTLPLSKTQNLRYGENPHQAAALYQTNTTEHSLLAEKLLQGKPLSYNNILDSDAAYCCVNRFANSEPSCVIVKHATPCGAATAKTLEAAYQKAFSTDPTSAFGGIIAVNQTLDVKTAEAIINQQFVEVIIAPNVTDDAKKVLQQKQNLRVLLSPPPEKNNNELRSVSGGYLIQQQDQHILDINACTVATKRAPTQAEINDLLFAWNVVQSTKSNAIIYAKDQQTLGIGSGQTSRVFSAKIAILKANDATLSLTGSVLASDAFFPFADGLNVAIAAGITAVIQPGGSKRDKEVIEAADDANIAMLFTGIRHFKH